eukprot:536513-Alexandrium_andersonii.AAC.1
MPPGERLGLAESCAEAAFGALGSANSSPTHLLHGCCACCMLRAALPPCRLGIVAAPLPLPMGHNCCCLVCNNGDSNGAATVLAK